jgi:hypothetical protein
MNRREFLSFTAKEAHAVDISCERLYMSYLDSLGAGTEESFLEEISRQLASASHLRLKESFWLEAQALRGAILPLLDRYKARGGTVEYR